MTAERAHERWSYWPAPDCRMGTAWRTMVSQPDGRVRSANGYAASPRAARRAIRRELRRARKSRP